MVPTYREFLKKDEESEAVPTNEAYSAFWGKEQLKWLAVLENMSSNMATVLLYLKSWPPSEDRFKNDRARILRTIGSLREDAEQFGVAANEIADFLEQSLNSMKQYRSRS